MDGKTDAAAPANNLAELFRKEAVRYQAARLQGEVMLKVRSPWLFLGTAFSILLLIVLVVASLGTYTRKERVAGRLVISEGAVVISSERHGFVESVSVRDGQVVEAGQLLFTLRLLSAPQTALTQPGSADPPAGCVPAEENADAGLCRISAPAKMTVGVVSVSPGQLVAAGMPMAELLPPDVRLAAELSVPSRSIGLIREGLPVALRYDAFEHRRFGSGRGKIESVSLTPLPGDRMTGAGMPAQSSYRVRVGLERDYMNAYGKAVPLRPGMTLEAEITIDRQSLLKWVLDPLYAAGRRG